MHRSTLTLLEVDKYRMERRCPISVWRKKSPLFVRRREEDGCSPAHSVNTFARDKQRPLNGRMDGLWNLFANCALSHCYSQCRMLGYYLQLASFMK